MATSPRKRTRAEVAGEYGHPWPWKIRELVEEHAVERNVDIRDLADRWACSPKVLGQWIRRHGFQTENYRAVR